MHIPSRGEICQQSRYAGFAVSLMGAGCETQSVVMSNQPRTLDVAARGGGFVEAVGSDLLKEVLARLKPIFWQWFIGLCGQQTPRVITSVGAECKLGDLTLRADPVLDCKT